MITAILKIYSRKKFSEDDPEIILNQSPEEHLRYIASLCLDIIGEGGMPYAQTFEEFLGYVNTPPIMDINGDVYVRCLINQEFAYILELLQYYGTYKDIIEIIIEHDGQIKYPIMTTGINENGDPIEYEEYLGNISGIQEII